MREEIINHKDFWNTRIFISNETLEEHSERMDYIINFEPRPEIKTDKDYWNLERKIFDETDHEYNGRVYKIKSACDYDVDEKAQDGYYHNDKNIENDIQKGIISPDPYLDSILERQKNEGKKDIS